MPIVKLNIEPQLRNLASEIKAKHNLESMEQAYEFILKTGEQHLLDASVGEDAPALGRPRKKRKFIVVKL